MENTSDQKEGRPAKELPKHICVTLLAHVDAGKTTLAESMLYLTGSIRRLGRVDHKDAFLDANELERARGITIFSKQAELCHGELMVTLLDTPGHVDFSAEMERTLQVPDYAILVISGSDGVQGHVETLWRLLKRYRIPVFLFVNKMDQEGTNRSRLMKELRRRLSDRCIDFAPGPSREEFLENLTLTVGDEGMLEHFLEKGEVLQEAISDAVANRKVFPCYFGSALKLEGVSKLLDGLERYVLCPAYPEEFGARIYKIARDSQGNRLTCMKITGGCLRVKMLLTNRKSSGEEGEFWEEKADQIRIYSGSSYQAVKEAPAGTVCAVTGLERTCAGEGLGGERGSEKPVLEPVLTYRICLPQGGDLHDTFLKLKELEEEAPELAIVWNEELGEIYVRVMGEVQIEILKSMIRDRFGTEVEFASGSIVYKETILETVESAGHFESFRHGAEIHLRLEPLERGRGLEFASDCSEDILDRNWQQLILAHLARYKFSGVLTGSEITDMRITLLEGRGQLKHTESGDFRQAACRAVRQGLKCAGSILLEPVCEFRLEVPAETIGRAIADIRKLYGSFQIPQTVGDFSVIEGTAPVVTMRDYQREVTAYTGSRGRFACTLKGYGSCHNEAEVISFIAYDPEQTFETPGAFVPETRDETERRDRFGGSFGRVGEKELEEIFIRTYGLPKRGHNQFKQRTIMAENETVRPVKRETKKEYLLVDGYNIIFGWKELRELAEVSLESAREKLTDMLSNYQGFKKCTLILVFDAYKVEGGRGEVTDCNNIQVVFTKETETADQYIEKVVHEIGRKYEVTVATSDALEQIIVLGQGARRISASGLKQEMRAANIEMHSEFLKHCGGDRSYLFEHLPENMADLMKDVRLGKKKL